MNLEELTETIFKQQEQLNAFHVAINQLQEATLVIKKDLTFVAELNNKNLDLIISQKAEIDVLKENLLLKYKK